MFLNDVYNEQKILKDKIVPIELVLGNKEFNKEMLNIVPQGNIYNHICGTDIIKTNPGQ